MKIFKSLISISIVAMLLTSGISAFAQDTQEEALETLFEIRGTYVDGLDSCPPLDVDGSGNAEGAKEGNITEGYDFTFDDGTTKKISKFEFYRESTGDYYIKYGLRSIKNQNPNKKYIFHADFYLKNENKNAGDIFNDWHLKSTSADKTIVSDASNNIANSEYRYYSFFPGVHNDSSKVNYFVNGFFDGTLSKKTTDNGFYGEAGSNNYGQRLPTTQPLKFNQWTSFDALFTKRAENQILIQPFMTGTQYANSYTVDGTVSELYADNIYYQELAVDNIDLKTDGGIIDGSTITVTPDDSLSFTANVYNQFGSEIGFKDQIGTVMEPLKFTIKDKNGNVVSDNNYFTLNDSVVPTSENIYVTTAKNSVAYNVGEGSWVTPTYDFTLNANGLTMGDTYTVTAELLNKDIYGSTEKNATFTVKVGSRNLVANADFSNGTTGWSTYFAGRQITVSDDETLGAKVGTVNDALLKSNSVQVYANKTYFVYSKVKTDAEFTGTSSGMDYMTMGFNSSISRIKPPAVGTWYDLAVIVTPTVDASNEVQFSRYIGDATTSYGNVNSSKLYVGEMLINSEITSASNQINVPYTGTNTLALSANVTAPNGVNVNDLNFGVTNTAPTLTNVWSVEEATGVSIDASTGVLTVDNTATAESVKVNVVSTYSYNGNTFTAEDDYVVEINPYVPGTNIVSNADFSNGTTGWSTYFAGRQITVSDDETLGAKVGTVNDALLKSNSVQVYANKTYFVYSKVKTDAEFTGTSSGMDYMTMGFNSSISRIKPPAVGTWYDLAVIVTPTVDASNEVQFSRYTGDATTSYGNVNAANVYVSEMLINSEITAEESQMDIPVSGANTLALTANVTAPNGVDVNALNFGVTNTAPTLTNEWSVEEVAGVSIDENTGVLTVDNTATADSVKVNVVSTYSYNGNTFTAEDEYTVILNGAVDYTLSDENVLSANIRSDYEDKCVIFAVYENGVLLGVEEVAMSFEKDIKSLYPTATEASIFIWETLSGMKPAASCEKITLN